MTLEMLVTSMFVGILTGCLAGSVMKDGGYGRIWDLVLGLAGGSAAGVVFSMLDITPNAGQAVTAMAGVAFVGAAVVVVAQRKIWYTRA